MKHNQISHTINFILFTSFTAIFGYTTPLSVSSSIHLYRRKWIHENIAGSIWEQRIVGFKLFFQGLDARNSSYCSRTSFTAWFRTTTSNPHYMKKGTHHYPTPGTRKKNSAHNIPNLKSTLHTRSNPTQEADAIHILHVIVSSHDNRLVVQRSRFAFAHD